MLFFKSILQTSVAIPEPEPTFFVQNRCRSKGAAPAPAQATAPAHDKIVFRKFKYLIKKNSMTLQHKKKDWITFYKNLSSIYR